MTGPATCGRFLRLVKGPDTRVKPAHDEKEGAGNALDRRYPKDCDSLAASASRNCSVVIQA